MPSDNFKKTETMKEEFVRSFSSAHQVIHCNYMYIYLMAIGLKLQDVCSSRSMRINVKN